VTFSRGTADIASRADWPPGRVLVVAATYQERANIEPLIDRVLDATPDLQLLIVDDDSPDGTAAAALERCVREPRLHVLVRRGRRGLGVRSWRASTWPATMASRSRSTSTPT